MTILINILLVFGAIVGMEGVAWVLHKYGLHTFLWFVHKDHHPAKPGLQKNDFVAFFFGIPSWLFIMFGVMHGNDWKLYIGIGITIYGVLYILFHDGLIHGRIKVFQNPKSVYLLGCKLGHAAHHVHDLDPDYDKDKDVVFGMLWVPKKYFAEAREILKKGSE